MKVIAITSGLVLLAAAAAWGLAEAQDTGGDKGAVSGKTTGHSKTHRRHGPPMPMSDLAKKPAHGPSMSMAPLAKKGAVTDSAHGAPLPTAPLAKKGAVTDTATGATPK